jgi:hypothetical protein
MFLKLVETTLLSLRPEKTACTFYQKRRSWGTPDSSRALLFRESSMPCADRPVKNNHLPHLRRNVCHNLRVLTEARK